MMSPARVSVPTLIVQVLLIVLGLFPGLRVEPSHAQEAGRTRAREARPGAPVALGAIEVEVVDVLAQRLSAKVELRSEDLPSPIVLRVPSGRLRSSQPMGQYTAFVYVYDEDVPVAVEIMDVVIGSAAPASLRVEVLEGVGGKRPLRAFDQDGDLFLDRVELAAGTDPADACSVPGQQRIPRATRVLAEGAKWYRGELHAHSSYGVGKESVSALIARAEKAGLDFLAIADRNTMAASLGPEFHSDSLVLIPAMEWGNDILGVALLYAPGTYPEPPRTRNEAKGMAMRLQAQGGVVAIAHPCFPTAPWQWGLTYVDAVQVWCRDWRGVPPVNASQLGDILRRRDNEGRFTETIARAAAMPGLSANGQAASFWDSELALGLHAAPIAGTMSSAAEVPLASPVTYVYAANKSLPAIIDGIRRGRTALSASVDGPFIAFGASVPGRRNAMAGDTIPTGTETTFAASVKGGEGMKLELLRDGRSIAVVSIDRARQTHYFKETPLDYAAYRAQVIGAVTTPGFGPVDVLAMSGVIYATPGAVSEAASLADSHPSTSSKANAP